MTSSIKRIFLSFTRSQFPTSKAPRTFRCLALAEESCFCFFVWAPVFPRTPFQYFNPVSSETLLTSLSSPSPPLGAHPQTYNPQHPPSPHFFCVARPCIK